MATSGSFAPLRTLPQTRQQVPDTSPQTPGARPAIHPEVAVDVEAAIAPGAHMPKMRDLFCDGSTSVPEIGTFDQSIAMTGWLRHGPHPQLWYRQLGSYIRRSQTRLDERSHPPAFRSPEYKIRIVRQLLSEDQYICGAGQPSIAATGADGVERRVNETIWVTQRPHSTAGDLERDSIFEQLVGGNENSQGAMGNVLMKVDLGQ